MDERQLRILRELGELGSVTAVAEALLVTPSAISQQLRLLQRAIPVPLTERQGRRLVLTDAGQALAGAAVEVETALARARHQGDAPAGRRLPLVHRINEFAVVAEVVAAGGGIALMPRLTMRPHPELVLRPLSGVQARRHIDALYRPERTARAAVRTVLTELRRIARSIQHREGDDRATS
ncbi:helix-turn-helix domain-containing protein [Streptomyces curacoi]|uniref:HTH lysR-type domain-containing protein n=1 Tax=Streptomyces curacoi TaxID=146536 RepID=A0A124H2A3_9ACTN|nr:LysR family transcriptional regulator [Streptomyces curacoi]KUM76005.1 hypothetical protein AQI70_15570 [Streptomyces curacoi]